MASLKFCPQSLDIEGTFSRFENAIKIAKRPAAKGD